MSVEPLKVEAAPLEIRVAAAASAAYQRLSPVEREWLLGNLNRSGEQSVVWSVSDSIEAPHDLWVLHRWSEASRTMDIHDIGYFPRRPLYLRRAHPDEDRWDNDGGGNPIR